MSHESFEVGEIAIAVNWANPKFNGLEVLVVSERGLHNCYHSTQGDITADGWMVEYDQRRIVARVGHLRKKRLPPDWVKLCNLTDIPREVTCA